MEKFTEYLTSLGLKLIQFKFTDGDSFVAHVENADSNVGKRDNVKKLANFEDFIFDGWLYNSKDKCFEVCYYTKPTLLAMKKDISEYVKNNGLEIIAIKDIGPKSFSILVKPTGDTFDLTKLVNYKSVVYDGYANVGDNAYELFYYFE